ncbi:MAG: aminotransferase class I/II-fold pyridoxal phosphate-dependent enzyme [Campylobacterales bacterium]|nr:aminotransferase class I/II-fold pyridoxal phosphate-dependent enzyme [Campylobacterales bacterium]
MRPFALEVFFSRWEFEATHHLTASDVESMSVHALLSLASPQERTAFEHTPLSYTQPWGDPHLCQAIAQTYDTLTQEHILCFAGAQEGIYTAMRTLLTKDDHAIVFVPNYQSAESLPLECCEVSGVALLEAQGWQPDMEALERAIRPNTKLISMNFPNNPTGAIISHENLAKLIALCRKHGIYLFSDEVYRLLELDERKRIPQIADVYEKGISLNVMSKAYGLPGLRIGWLASRDTHALAAFERYKHYLSICNSAPSEALALIALNHRTQILERNRALLAENIARLDTFFAQYPTLFAWNHPDGSCVAYPKYTGKGDVEALCQLLIQEYGVLLLPPSIYHSELLPTPNDHFRIGFGRKGIHAGLDMFGRCLEEKWLPLQG